MASRLGQMFNVNAFIIFQNPFEILEITTLTVVLSKDTICNQAFATGTAVQFHFSIAASAPDLKHTGLAG